MKNSSGLLLGTITLFAATLTASAQIVSQVDGGAATEITSIPSGTVGTAGYYFFHDEDNSAQNNTGTADRFSLPSFVSSVTGSGGYSVSDAPSNGHLTIAGVSYTAGRDYNFFDGSHPTTPQFLAQIDLTGTVPLSFNIGFLQDNFASIDNPSQPDSTKITLELFDPTVSTTVAVSSVQVNTTNTGNLSTPDFYFANVTGAVSGDYLKVSGLTPAATSGVGGLGTGGFTFDIATTPEPSTIALMFAGLGALVLVSRARRNA